MLIVAFAGYLAPAARLAARVETLGGTIRIDSPAGQETRLQIDLPIHRGDRPSR